jgi:hypothetical protein
VKQTVQKHFRHDDFVLVLVAPAGQVRETAEKFGTTTVLSLDEAVK